LYSVSHGLAELTYVSVCPLKEICDTLEVSVLLVEQNARAAIEIAD
jgi:ABC-type branched-subunit amino acid transport system ATPase component